MLLEDLTLRPDVLNKVPAPVHKVHQLVRHHFHIPHLYYLCGKRLLLVEGSKLLVNLGY